MTRRPAHPRRSWPAVAAVALAAASGVRGDPPLLQQLSDETQRIYAHARLGMVRVRLPTPQWLVRQNQLLLKKWGAQLSPAAQQQFLLTQGRPPGPSTAPALAWPAGGLGVVVSIPPPPDRVLVATGLLIDSAGHAVFPLYIDRADLNGATLPALTGDGRSTVAEFVGSDGMTKLTVLKLADPGTHVADLGPADGARPADGSLAMVVSTDGAAHLTVWSGAPTDTGLVLRPDGACAGFAFADDFLPVATARPIVEQLVATGTVVRPSLGVTGEAVRRAELFDPSLPVGSTAVRILKVDANSAAARADLRPADVILAVAGQAVGPPTFAAVITPRRGATVIRVRRGNQTIDLTVDLHAD